MACGYNPPIAETTWHAAITLVGAPSWIPLRKVTKMQQDECTVWFVLQTWLVSTEDLQWPHAITPVALKTRIFNSLGVKHPSPHAHHTNSHGHTTPRAWCTKLASFINKMICVNLTRVNYLRSLPTTKVKEESLHLKSIHICKIIGRPINWELLHPSGHIP